jgi:FkbM family methyltransferase
MKTVYTDTSMGLSKHVFLCVKAVYTGRLRKLARRLRVHDILNTAFWEIRFLFGARPIRLRKHSGTVRATLQSDDSLESYPEQEIVEDILSTVRRDDIVYDVGANIGRYSIPIEIAYPDIETVAFEPEHKNIDLLRKNAKLNGVSLTVLKAALSDSDGKMDLIISEEPGCHRLSFDENDADTGVETVPVYSGDTLVHNNEVPPPDIIKIDVEGAEKKVIDGFVETLSDGHCRVIYCEVHPKLMKSAGNDVDDLRDMLRSFGFEITTLSQREARIEGQTVRQSFLKAQRVTDREE